MGNARLGMRVPFLHPVVTLDEVPFVGASQASCEGGARPRLEDNGFCAGLLGAARLVSLRRDRCPGTIIRCCRFQVQALDCSFAHVLRRHRAVAFKSSSASTRAVLNASLHAARVAAC
jgi:hypothetical protein